MQRNQLTKSAQSWVETRYKLNGRTKNGADCLGFILEIAKEFQIKSKSNNSYIHELCNFKYRISGFDKRLEEMLDLHLYKKEKYEQGDLVLIKVSNSPQHLAFISSVEPLKIIHAFVPARKIIEELVTEKMQNNFYKFYSFFE
jgi:cell wall-associated NlpC family hydrolase